MARMTTNSEKVRLEWCRAKREFYVLDLHPLYRERYIYLCKLMSGTYWAPYSGIRSFDEQAKLYESGRTRPGRIVTNARPGDSAHNWGCATDWAEFRPEYKNSEAWDHADWGHYRESVKESGLDWGGDWNRDGVTQKGENDFPHCQLPLKKSWRYIGDTYRISGVEQAEIEISLYSIKWKIEEEI